MTSLIPSPWSRAELEKRLREMREKQRNTCTHCGAESAFLTFYPCGYCPRGCVRCDRCYGSGPCVAAQKERNE